MRGPARVQAAIELLDAVILVARDNGPPADRLIGEYFRSRRYAGGGDRRAVRDLVYRAIRACGPVPASGRAAMLRLAEEDAAVAAAFDGSPHAPAPRRDEERAAEEGIAPAWLIERLAASGLPADGMGALLGRAPLDIRVNRLKARRDTIELPESGEPLAAPDALRFAAGTPVESWDAYRDGLIEVQDHGSQSACAAVGALPGETVIDLCAGAGGKTLALAAAMEGRGRIIACDTDARRLGALMPRARRAGAEGMIETVLLDPGRELERLAAWRSSADRVLIDAPCSGTGTWRRNPETRWRLTPKRLEQMVKLQARLLDLGAALVRPGGQLTYVTCSLLDEEGPDQIDGLTSRNGDLTSLPVDLPLGAPHGAGWRLCPGRDGTDGFFIARVDAR
jgi:16S rRNA (cytosine967-C5)-methyltransferase